MPCNLAAFDSLGCEDPNLQALISFYSVLDKQEDGSILPFFKKIGSC